MDIDEKLERCYELETIIDNQKLLLREVTSKDLIEKIKDFIEELESELQELDTELQEIAENERRYLNIEYMRNTL